MSQLGDGPIEPEFIRRMNLCMEAVDKAFNGDEKPKQVGVVMLVFQYGATDGRCNFISNGADRGDLVTLFKEMIQRFEGQPEISGRA